MGLGESRVGSPQHRLLTDSNACHHDSFWPGLPPWRVPPQVPGVEDVGKCVTWVSEW